MRVIGQFLNLTGARHLFFPLSVFALLSLLYCQNKWPFLHFHSRHDDVNNNAESKSSVHRARCFIEDGGGSYADFEGSVIKGKVRVCGISGRFDWIWGMVRFKIRMHESGIITHWFFVSGFSL